MYLFDTFLPFSAICDDKGVGWLDDLVVPGYTFEGWFDGQGSAASRMTSIPAGTLSPREVKVLSLRFGLSDGKEQTLEEVGRFMGVTRERARQIEAKAIRKLQHSSRAKKTRRLLCLAFHKNLWAPMLGVSDNYMPFYH